MTRRWPDMRITHNQWSTGDAIAAGVGFIVAILLLLLAIALIAPYAHAHDSGQWPDTNTSRWFKSLMQPDNPRVSCCGESDAYWADKVENGTNGELIAVITDDRDDVPLGRHHVPVGTRIPVPHNKIKWDQGNPTGHIVIFGTYIHDSLVPSF